MQVKYNSSGLRIAIDILSCGRLAQGRAVSGQMIPSGRPVKLLQRPVERIKTHSFWDLDSRQNTLYIVASPEIIREVVSDRRYESNDNGFHLDIYIDRNL